MTKTYCNTCKKELTGHQVRKLCVGYAASGMEPQWQVSAETHDFCSRRCIREYVIQLGDDGEGNFEPHK